MSLLEQYFRRRLDQKKSVALIIDYDEAIIPMSDAGSTGNEDRTSQVYLSRWAHDPMFLASDFTCVMITENLADLNKTIVQNPYTTEIKINIPGEEDRLAFVKYETQNDDFKKLSDVSPAIIAQQTAGLNYVNIRSVLSNARENQEKITFDGLSENKKDLIEAEAYGLLEFVETPYSLDNVAGHTHVKQHRRDSPRPGVFC